MYHCRLAVDAIRYETFSFNVMETTFLILSGWLSTIAKCLVGALI